MVHQLLQLGGGRKMCCGGWAFTLFDRSRTASPEPELVEAITHVMLDAGWPRGMAAMGVAKQLFDNDK